MTDIKEKSAITIWKPELNLQNQRNTDCKITNQFPRKYKRTKFITEIQFDQNKQNKKIYILIKKQSQRTIKKVEYLITSTNLN